MSVIGIDYGNVDCVLAQAKRGGIDIVLNENSNRKNPNMICTQGNQRLIGEAAVSVARMHYKNCATDIKRLIGLQYQQEEAQALIQTLPFACVELSDGTVGVKLNYSGEENTFRCEQLVAMMLTKLQGIAAAANNGVGNSDVVVSVPGFFTDVQRRAMLSAAKIAGINCLRLMNEHTAVALAYGIYKSARNLFHESEPQYVMFIDLGHSSYSVSIVSFIQGKLEVKATAFDAQLGGRNFDWALAKHVAAEFQAKHKIDPLSIPKSRLKLLSACEKAKKNLSPHGVNATNLNVECLVEEYDYNGRIELSTFEDLIQDLLNRLDAPILKTLADAGIEKSQLSSVEIVGGGTRVASVKRKWSEILGMDASKNNYGLSTTLNADESVARGCALQSAILSPLFQVKEFIIADSVSYPVCVSWDPSEKPVEKKAEGQMDTTEDGNGEEEPESNSLVILTCKDEFPKTRRVTLRRSETFEVRADYDASAEALLSKDAARHLGSFTVSGIPSLQEGEEVPRIRVNFKQDIHGIFNVSSSQMMQEIMEETPAPAPAPATESTDKMDEDKKDSEEKKDGEKTEEKTTDKSKEATAPKKKRFRKIELSVETHRPSGLTIKDIADFNEKELRMGQQDRIIEETANKRNELESYIYDMRNQLCDQLKDFISSEDKQAFESQLQDSEDWLYSDEGFESSKSIYISKLKALADLGKPIKFRLSESTNRPAAQAELLALTEEYKRLANNTDEKYEHWNDEDRENIRKAASIAESWLYDELPKQSELSSAQDPILTSDMIRAKMKTMRDTCLPIINKPKPKVEEPPKSDPVKTESDPTSEGNVDMEAENKDANAMDLD